MQNLQNGYTPAAAGDAASGRPMDWSTEITVTPMLQGQNRPAVSTGMGGMQGDGAGGMMMDSAMGRQMTTGRMNSGMNGSRQMMSGGGMMSGMSGGQMMNMGYSGMSRNLAAGMQHQLPSEVVEAPTTVGEAYLGSLKSTLNRNKGNFIVATFLIGTQNMVSGEGILYDVGNDFVTIYQPGRDRYIVIDMYSLRYMEFYDTSRRDLCNEILENNGMQGSR